MRTEDRIRKFVLENFHPDKPHTAKDVADATEIQLTTICNILREMKEEEILSRRRHGKRWEYFLINPHDPEEYIEDKKAEVILAKKYASLHGNLVKLQELNRKLEKLAKQHDLHAKCDCGRRVSLKISVEVIDDYDTG